MNIWFSFIFDSSCQAGGIRRRVGTGIRRRGQGTSGGSRKGGMPGIVTKTYSYVLIFETDFDIAPPMGCPKNPPENFISDKTCGILVEEIARSTSSWVSDPEDQWAWLYKVMDEARRKKQNVS